MKILFGTLLCHRDVETFLFNWFVSRVHLKKGFSIPHLILNDGTLTEEDFIKLNKLTNVFIEKDKVDFYKVQEPIYTAKLKLFEIGFMKYGAERVVVLDSDVFFFRSWDSDLADILLSEAIALMDFGYSCGPEQQRYEEIFKAPRNSTTPTCNTGIFSTIPEHYHRILLNLAKQIDINEFHILGDQGICFAAFNGMLNYIQGIKVAAPGAGLHKEVWDWLLSQNGMHLLGMKSRKTEYYSIIEHTLNLLPKELSMGSFIPDVYQADGAMYSYDVYDFERPLQSYPSLCGGRYLTDAIYLAGDSKITWTLPPQITRFDAELKILDYSAKENISPIEINGRQYNIGSISVPVDGHKLEIKTNPGVRTFYALVRPRLSYNIEIPTTAFES
jgi:hypothetical protein